MADLLSTVSLLLAFAKLNHADWQLIAETRNVSTSFQLFAHFFRFPLFPTVKRKSPKLFLERGQQSQEELVRSYFSPNEGKEFHFAHVI